MPDPPPARALAVDIVRQLTRAGHVAYLAGGCVRDAVLGRVPKDYDVATDAIPDTVRAMFRGARFVGEAFGVALVRREGAQVEVATFRSDGVYEDGRRPVGVTFTDAEHDAQRRDFTINGLFAVPWELEQDAGETPAPPSKFQADPPRDRIIDFVGGVADLEAGVVRAIGDADRRFAEDYLRMLRAVRFAARLGFTLEQSTADAIREHAPRLARISRERIGGEMGAMLQGDRPMQAVELVRALRLDDAIFDQHFDGLDVGPLSGLPAEAGAPTRLAAWLAHLAPKVEPAHARRALCLSNADFEAMVGVLRVSAMCEGWHDLGIARKRRLIADPNWQQAAMLRHAAQPDTAHVATVDAEARTLERDGVGIAPPPLIDGSDLIAAGLKPGPIFGEMLWDIYDAQLEGRVQTRDAALALLNEPLAS